MCPDDKPWYKKMLMFCFILKFLLTPRPLVRPQHVYLKEGELDTKIKVQETRFKFPFI